MSNIVDYHLPNADPVIASMLASGEREAALIEILNRSYPHTVRAYILMKMLGIEFTIRSGGLGEHVHPHSAYVSFAITLVRVDRSLQANGMRLFRTGGAYDSCIGIQKYTQ